MYVKLVDSIIVGPYLVSDTEAERTLGIDNWQYNKSRHRRDQVSLLDSLSFNNCSLKKIIGDGNVSGWEGQGDKVTFAQGSFK